MLYSFNVATGAKKGQLPRADAILRLKDKLPQPCRQLAWLFLSLSNPWQSWLTEDVEPRLAALLNQRHFMAWILRVLDRSIS